MKTTITAIIAFIAGLMSGQYPSVAGAWLVGLVLVLAALLVGVVIAQLARIPSPHNIPASQHGGGLPPKKESKQ